MNAGHAGRREFLARSTQTVALVGCGGLAWGYLLHEQARASPDRFRPPGAESAEEFYARCIKCGQCVAACPFDTLALAPSGAHVPIGTPHFVPRRIPCYMCEDIPCQEACPTGAISADLADIEDARMGLASIDIENCLSWQGLRCEVCYRECPLKDRAITVEHHPRKISKHAMLVPLVHGDACTGCGVCEKACPTELAAIRVVQPDLVRGEIGAHYRLGTERGATPGSRRADTPPPSSTNDSRTTLDYLNDAGDL